MDHDQLFKALLQTFFREFLELFYPATAARLDLTRVDFLGEELLTAQPKGSPRRVDIIGRVQTLDGVPEFITIHVEVQAQRDRDFGYRMWEYYSLLRFRYGIPVLPIAVFLTPGGGGLTQEVYTERTFDDETLTFRYRAVSLPDLPAEDYRERDNPLGPALSALMRLTRDSRPRHKARSLNRVAGYDLSRAEQELLVVTTDRYLKLSDTEAEEFGSMVHPNVLQETENVLAKYRALYAEEAMQEGHQRGLEQGLLRGKKDVALRLARLRFAAAFDRIAPTVEAATTDEALDSMIDQLITAGSAEGCLEALAAHREP